MREENERNEVKLIKNILPRFPPFELELRQDQIEDLQTFSFRPREAFQGAKLSLCTTIRLEIYSITLEIYSIKKREN